VSELSPWRRLWRAIDVAMDRYGAAQAESTGRLLKDVRLAVSEYGREADPEAFDEYGQPLGPEEDDVVNGAHWKKHMAAVLDELVEVEE